MVDLAGPAHVGHVDHAVDTLLQSHEGTVGSKVADGTGNDGANGEALLDEVPGILVELTDAEGDLLLLHGDVEHHGLDLLVKRQHVARAGDALGPGKLGNVHQAFHALLQLHEGAVGEQLGDAALDVGTDRVLLLDVGPGVVGELLETQGDALLVAVHVEDKHLELLTDVQHLGGGSRGPSSYP